MKNPIEYFFSLGDKVTNGDPKRKADYDYYLFWLMFLAFCSVGIGNLISFFKSGQIQYLGWSLVMVAILWFQYFGLIQMYQFRKMLKTPLDIERSSKEDMLKEFK